MRSFTLLARGKTSAPQSAAYGRMPMATCCRKRQLFSCRLPSASERRNLWKNSARVLYSLFGNADCIPPSRGGAKTRSKACVVLPCLQGVKRARRNRRHMGACPWQLVAESAGFSAADYSPPFLLGGSFFGSQGLSPCNAYALRRAFALVRLKRNAWLCPCKQAKPSRPFRVTQKSSRAPLSSRACRWICPPVIPSLSRDLYANIVKIKIEILRRRA